MQTTRKAQWLVGIRLRGGLRRDAQRYMRGIQEILSDGERRFPYISLFGPFSTRMTEKQITDAVVAAIEAHPDAMFSTDGLSSRVHGKRLARDRGAITIRIEPNDSLRRMRYDIARALLPNTRTARDDHCGRDDFEFYVTLAVGSTGKSFKDMSADAASVEMRYEDIRPELVLYLGKKPVFAYLTGHGVTPARPEDLYSEPETGLRGPRPDTEQERHHDKGRGDAPGQQEQLPM